MHRAGKYTFDLSFLEYRIVRLRRSRFIAKVVSGISLLRERERVGRTHLLLYVRALYFLRHDGFNLVCSFFFCQNMILKQTKRYYILQIHFEVTHTGRWSNEFSSLLMQFSSLPRAAQSVQEERSVKLLVTR